MVHLAFLVAFGGGRGLRTALDMLAPREAAMSGYEPDGFVKHALQIALCESRALEVLLSPDFLAHLKGLFVLNRGSSHLAHALLGCFIIAQIELGANENDGNARSMMLNFRGPLRRVNRNPDIANQETHLGLDIVKRCAADDGEADQEDVGLRVGQGSQTIIIFLTSSVPQSQTDGFTVYHDTGRIVVESIPGQRIVLKWAESHLHSGNVLARESIGGV